MQAATSSNGSQAQGASHFVLTRWSVVVTAGRCESTHARDALEQLCRAYWQPIYAFVRRQGHSPADAQDLTQEFFARLLEKNYLQNVDPAKGRFRSFLLASVKHFLANEWDKARAQKRGGERVLLSINSASAETAYAIEPVEQLTPDKIFERRWALTLLAEVMAQLRAEYRSEGKTELFEQLKSTLTGERRSVAYAEIAVRLHSSEGAVKVAVYRLRRRYRELLRSEIAQTVASPEEVEEEIRALFAALQA